MTAILHNRRYLVLVLVIASVILSVVATVAIVTAQIEDTHRTLGSRLGSAYANGKVDIVLRINGNPITHVELAVEKIRYHNNLWGTKDLIERAVPSVEETANSDDQYRGPLPEHITEGLNAELLLLEKYGQDTVALANLILEYARFSKAVEAGHLPSESEVTEFVEQIRQSHEQHVAASAHPDWGITAGTAGIIEAVGAERYWEEIYPARTVRNMADASWIKAAIEDYNHGESAGVPGRVIMGIDRELDREAIADVDVEIVESGDVKAAPEEAIAYLQELWQVLDSPVEPNANPTPERIKPPE